MGSAEQSLGRSRRVANYNRNLLVLAFAVIVFPLLPFVPFSVLGKVNIVCRYALVAIALVVLTGWVGQVSLGHGALVGVGAYVTGLLQGGLNIAFPANMLWGAAAGALAASVLGIVALRVRGLYLAVATLIFSWTADVFLFQQRWLTKHSSVELTPIGRRGAFPFFDFTSRRTFYYLSWAVVIVTIFLMANLRDRRIGRAFFAVRGSEMAAASLGIDVVRTKLIAFAVSGGIAGAAGSLMIIGAQVVTIEQFSLKASLFYLGIAVVGGMISLGGAVGAAFIFAGIEELFFRVPAVGEYLEIIFAGLLAAVLLIYPGGLSALSMLVRNRLRAWVQKLNWPFFNTVTGWFDGIRTRRLALIERLRSSTRSVIPRRSGTGSAPAIRARTPLERSDPVPKPLRGVLDRVFPSRQVLAAAPPLDLFDEAGDTIQPWEQQEFDSTRLSVADRESRRPLIEADALTVKFGGLVAVENVSLSVREGEIVGLIGPNGAGKTTTFNAIAGFVTPTSGRVRLQGVDVTTLPVHVRSRLGIARTFQVIQLFPQLSVFENLLVATYMHDSSGLFGNMLISRRSLIEEHSSRERVRRVIALVGLEDVSDRFVAGLPFGVLRMVEVARALVTGAPVMMLDEPASGLDEVETERLAKLVRFIRSLGVTILLIEHDVQMVTGVSDYMYVLDQGKLIAEGPPEEIQRDHAVIAAYLGEAPDEDASTMDKVGARGE